MPNKFYTIMVVPEKTNRTTRIVVPSYVFKGGILSAAFLAVLAAIMVLDYANVMNQINENKQLKVENRQLRQSVQVFKTKVVSIENTLDRVKTFVTKLRIITNIEESGTPAVALPVPAEQPSVPASSAPAQEPALPIQAPEKNGKNATDGKTSKLEVDTDILPTQPLPMSAQNEAPNPYEQVRAKRLTLLAALMIDEPATATLSDADGSQFVKTEFEKLDAAYEEVNRFALSTEQETQDILEKLGEKRALLASTPTLLPTKGYITSEYSIRVSPFDGRRKMHEGIDIANRYGADIIAPADGTVSFSGTKPGYGKLIIIDHGNGLETRYAHNAKLFVAAGGRVKRGQRIGAVGNTGHSTGPHCHYEVHANGLPVDPCWYILDQPGLCKAR